MRVALPWEIHPDLTQDRLMLVGSWIAQGRHDAVDTHRPDIGGNAWTLGTNAYAYGKFRIEQAHEAAQHDWLGIVDKSNQFIFKIGDVPVRFFKGAADEPTARTLRKATPELRQLRLMLEGGRGRMDLTYRFAVDTDLDGDVASITFVGLDGETAECYWEVPLIDKVATIHVIETPLAQGVELPPPAVGLPQSDEKARSGTEA